MTQSWLERANRFFELPLQLRSRILVLVAAVLLVPSFLFPLYLSVAFLVGGVLVLRNAILVQHAPNVAAKHSRGKRKGRSLRDLEPTI